MQTIIRLPTVRERTGLSRSQIYSLIRQGHFPRQVELGAKAVGWIEGEIQGWIAAKINTSRNGIPLRQNHKQEATHA